MCVQYDGFLYRGQFMHNLIPYNQLAGSKHPEHSGDPQDDLIDEYYECLVDCEDDQSSCKRIFKEVLT